MMTTWLETHKGGFRINWEQEGMGFGQISVINNGEDLPPTIETEYMTKEFVKKVFNQFVDEVISAERID